MMLFAALPMAKIVPFAIFGMFAVGAWLILEKLGSRKPRAEERLDELRNPQSRRRGEENAPVKKSATMSKMLAKASPMAKPLQPKSAEDVGKLRRRLGEAGFRNETGVGVFLGLKFIGLIIGLTCSGAATLLTVGMTQKALIYSVGITAVLFYLPDIIVWLMARHRKDAIFLGLPDVLDLLVVCVEAGLGLDQAMRKVSEEMKKSCRILSEEFTLCNFQLQMGAHEMRSCKTWEGGPASTTCGVWRRS